MIAVMDLIVLVLGMLGIFFVVFILIFPVVRFFFWLKEKKIKKHIPEKIIKEVQDDSEKRKVKLEEARRRLGGGTRGGLGGRGTGTGRDGRTSEAEADREYSRFIKEGIYRPRDNGNAEPDINLQRTADAEERRSLPPDIDTPIKPDKRNTKKDWEDFG